MVLLMMITIVLTREEGMRPSSELLVIKSGRVQIIQLTNSVGVGDGDGDDGNVVDVENGAGWMI